jgi:hypothetical protein
MSMQLASLLRETLGLLREIPQILAEIGLEWPISRTT